MDSGAQVVNGPVAGRVPGPSEVYGSQHFRSAEHHKRLRWLVVEIAEKLDIDDGAVFVIQPSPHLFWIGRESCGEQRLLQFECVLTGELDFEIHLDIHVSRSLVARFGCCA